MFSGVKFTPLVLFGVVADYGGSKPPPYMENGRGCGRCGEKESEK